MAQLFRPRATTIARLLPPVLLVVGIASIAAIAEFHEPVYKSEVQEAPQQPVPFSHQHHVGGLGLDCQYCHQYAEQSSYAGMPPTHTCMSCHSQVWTNAELLEPVRQSYETGEPLEWTGVYTLPEYVQFSHQPHVNNGIGCESCHGRMDRQHLTRQVHAMNMEWCLECHRNPEKYVRPRDEIYTLGWAEEHPEPRPDLVEEYRIDDHRLIQCSTCHY